MRVVNDDAMVFVDQNTELWDAIIIDFPDPSNFQPRQALHDCVLPAGPDAHCAQGGAIAIQCTSPFVARKSFWCIDETLQACGLITAPYHTNVPSFGEWGFILASPRPLPDECRLPDGLRFLDDGKRSTELFALSARI